MGGGYWEESGICGKCIKESGLIGRITETEKRK